MSGAVSTELAGHSYRERTLKKADLRVGECECGAWSASTSIKSTRNLELDHQLHTARRRGN